MSLDRYTSFEYPGANNTNMVTIRSSEVDPTLSTLNTLTGPKILCGACLGKYVGRTKATFYAILKKNGGRAKCVVWFLLVRND